MQPDIVLAQPDHLDLIKQIADRHREKLGFLNRAIVMDAIQKQEILVHPHGFLHFHHRRDAVSVLYHLCVDTPYHRHGIGSQLLAAWEEQAVQAQIRKLRLKCPIYNYANGFYAKTFRRVQVEPGKRCSLVVWEKPILAPPPQTPTFFTSLSTNATEIKSIKQLWQAGGDQRNPFQHVIYSPISSPKATSSYFQAEKQMPESNSTPTEIVAIDCGAYQVQCGKLTNNQLLDFLLDFYPQNQWADYYVLPDIVPRSQHSPHEVEQIAKQSLNQCRSFFLKMPPYIQARAIAPVQGKTPEQIIYCLETYAKIGIRYVGFGSWGTSGPQNSINQLSRSNLNLFRLVYATAREYQMQVHAFGIGSPQSLARLQHNQTLPHSLDSSSWWKSANFGNVFLPNQPQIHLTKRHLKSTTVGFTELKQTTSHHCRFCESVNQLRHSRNHRILHNLSVWLDLISSNCSADQKCP